MPKFRVYASAEFTYTKIIEAPTEKEALEIAYDIDDVDEFTEEAMNDWLILEAQEMDDD